MSMDLQHCVADSDAQRIIDAEIASYEERIRALKTRRNLESPISKLPVELMARIFLFAKNSLQWYEYTGYGHDKERTWLNVAGVCRRWREIVLDTPRMWCSFDVSRNEHVSEMLARSKHAPLQIRCSRFPYIGPHFKEFGEIIMPHINRLQELDISSYDSVRLSALLCRNPGIPAPILEVLRLKNCSGQLLLCKEVLSRGMPLLRILELTHGSISSVLPPLPRLVRLQLRSVPGGDHSLPASMLLLSLQNTPNLKELDLAYAIGGSTDGGMSTKIDLPRLLRVAIVGGNIASLAVLKSINYPPSTIVKFDWSVAQAQELEESNLAEICSRLGGGIRKIEIGFAVDLPQSFSLSAWINDAEPRLTIRVSCRTANRFLHACIQLCTAIPVSQVDSLHIGGFQELQKTGWSDLLSGFGMVRELHANDIHLNLISALLKENKEHYPLPMLRHLTMENCVCFVSFDDVGGEDRLLDVLFSFLHERKTLESPIKTLTIRTCRILEEHIEALEEYVDVDWDGEEILTDEQENGEDESDDLYDGMYSPSWFDLF